ncbi:TonB-dependent receptor [Sphingomonas sp.]|uniref:TonB-dependent receptor n=1 Tax=Sphingomonas sp. TaxID=28214 RepID=UPI003D6D3A95
MRNDRKSGIGGASLAILAGALVSLPATAQTVEPAPAASAAVPVAAPAAEPAQDAAPDAAAQEGANDIIVTAQRRDQRLQDVPISITALTSSELTGRGITSTHDIAQSVTGMTITESGGYVQPFIRGVGSTVTNLGEPGSAATYIDGVYMPTVNGQLYELANVDSIQVLKGPQGTLFGRNANTGAIIITTRQPQQEAAGSFTAGFGNFNSVKLNGFLTGGLAEGIAISLAGNYDRHDGWFHNLNPANGAGARIGDSERYTLRGAILIEPSSTLKITLSADGSHGDDASPIILQPINGYQGYVPGGLRPYAPYDYIGNENIRYLTGQWGLSGKIDWDLGSVSLVSTTAFRHYLSKSVFYDSDTTPARLSAINNRDVGNNLTQELLLSSNGSGAFSWVVGGFYLRQNGKLDPLRIYSGAGSTTIEVQQITEAFAGFADATLKLGKFEITGGLRYSNETKTISGQSNGIPVLTDESHTWNAFTPRAVLAYHPDHDTMVYASFSRGFKSGAFNANALSKVPINPESVDAYEIGAKLSPMPGVTINGSVFHYNTKDLQVQALNPNTNLIELRNAAKVRSNGADLDIVYSPSRELNLKLGVSYLNAKFTEFKNAQVFVPSDIVKDGRNMTRIVDVTGKRNVRSPDWTINFAADYKVEMSNGGSIVPSFNVYYSSRFYWTTDNRIAEPSHVVANASVTWNLPGDRFSVTVWGRNITDEVRFRNVSATAQADRRAADEPALYGVRLGYKF